MSASADDPYGVAAATEDDDEYGDESSSSSSYEGESDLEYKSAEDEDGYEASLKKSKFSILLDIDWHFDIFPRPKRATPLPLPSPRSPVASLPRSPPAPT